MAGEMNKSEVTKEAYPYHFALARALKGTVEPFDQYQGPFVNAPGIGFIWLIPLFDGQAWKWYNRASDLESDICFLHDENTLRSTLEGKKLAQEVVAYFKRK